MRLETANISDILYLFGQANFTFLGKSLGILKSSVSGNDRFSNQVITTKFLLYLERIV